MGHRRHRGSKIQQDDFAKQLAADLISGVESTHLFFIFCYAGILFSKVDYCWVVEPPALHW